MKICGAWRVKKILTKLNMRGLILMYHRIADLSPDPWQISISPSNFEAHMNVLKKYCQIVTMQGMRENLRRLPFGKKEAVVTFDDGYAANFHYAKPILERQEIPVSFFITTGVIGSHEEFWWDVLEQIILESKVLPELFEIEFSETRYRWQINSNNRQERLTYTDEIVKIPENDTLISAGRLYFVLWKILSKFSPQAKKETLEKIALWAGQKPTPRTDYLPMSSEELTKLGYSRLFEIGAHTVNHPFLSLLSVEEQKEEIQRSKQCLEEILHKPIVSFCYPHGDYSAYTPELVKDLKFKNACTVVGRAVSRNDNPYLLPRLEVLNWNGEQFEQRIKKWLTQV